MSQDNKQEKITRVLVIYTQLLNGRTVNKAQAADIYGVNERTIQRDISDIRNFLEDPDLNDDYNTVVYDSDRNGFRMDQQYREKLTNPEILAVCKILLDSRALTKKEMSSLLHKLISGCVPKANQKLVSDLIKNEEYHYIQPRHGKVFIDKLWTIAKAVRHSNYLEIKYHRLKGDAVVSRKVKPVGIMFSEFYFYMCAFIDDEEVRKDFNLISDANPTIYRIDRIDSLTILEERFHIPYSNRFEEGEFRKRVQFMFGGKLRRVRFKYTGLSIESVLDRLPTARILEEKEGEYLIEAETYGAGIDYWMKGQGSAVEEV